MLIFIPLNVCVVTVVRVYIIYHIHNITYIYDTHMCAAIFNIMHLQLSSFYYKNTDIKYITINI